MVTIVLLTGAINLGLGFCLAVLLERPVDLSSLRFARRMVRRRGSRPKPQPADATGQPPPSASEVTPPPEPPSTARNEFAWLFPEWAELLTGKQIVVESFPEALLWVASIKLAELCDQLRQCEQQTRQTTVEQPITALRAICADCRTHFADWKTAIQGCDERESYGDQLDQINHWLLEPVQQLQQVEQLSRQVEAEGTSGIDGKLLRQHIQPIDTHFRMLRDHCEDSIAKWLAAQKRLGELPAAEHTHPGSKVLSRIGLEATIHEWIDKDPDRVRMASAILVDIDHCTQLNDRHGLSQTDCILSDILRLLADVVRKDRGFDRVAHFAGSTFLVFLGDTALRNAMVGAERVRQNIGAAAFQIGDTRVAITASCAVTEWNSPESFGEMVGRLRIGLAEAKTAGRNCTIVCGPEENRVAPQNPMQVTAREFAIEPS